MKVSVIIPTWRRVEYLTLAFAGLAAQNRPADEVVVGCREDDASTLAWLAANPQAFQVKIARLTRPGTVASMQAALEQTSGDLVCLLDDDAAPEPNWLALLITRFEQDASLGGLGGRDLLAYIPPEDRDQHLEARVGVGTWYGKPIGNHHCGQGGFRYVDVVKGCNCAFRGEVIRKVGFETRLRGKGTQHEWEHALCLDVKRAGFRIGYDPSIRVLHHVAPRFGNDQNHRGGFDADGIEELAYNRGFVTASRMSGWSGFTRKLYLSCVGSIIVPGLLQYLRLRWIRRDPTANKRWRAACCGWREGLADGAKARG